MEDKDAPVVLRNTQRRPLIFQVAGKTVRLSPGEQLKVPTDWLGSAELQRCCGTGLVEAQHAGAAAKPASASAEPDEDDADDERDDRESKRSKSSKPKRPKHEN